MLTIALVIILILVLSGFFSGTESALVSLGIADVESLVEQKKIGAKVLKKVHSNIDRSVITILIFNNIVNIVGSIVIGQLVITLYGDAALAVITTGLTFGIIIFSEIFPKSLGIHYAERISLTVAPIIYVLTLLLLPLIIILEAMTNYLKRGERKHGTEEQIRSLVSHGRREGHIENDEGQLIHRAFILNDRTAEDLMSPLKDLVGIESTVTIQEAADKVVRHPYSRFPVFGDSIHDVRGVLMDRDLFEAFYDGKQKEGIEGLMRETIVVDAAEPADVLICRFRDEHKHLAVVQNDGKTVGVVSFEDVLEALVGNIDDEVDADQMKGES